MAIKSQIEDAEMVVYLVFYPCLNVDEESVYNDIQRECD